MKAIGGYFGLECRQNNPYYSEGIYLNVGRNCLRYLIQSLGISKIFIPLYTCNVVRETIIKEDCEVVTYNLDSNMLPERDFPSDAYIVYNNYFGVLGKNVELLAKQYPNLIVDNAQAFYSLPRGRAAIYSPRKFFGLPDGGILVGRDIPRLNLTHGTSYDVCSHLLKRIDCGAQAGYQNFIENDAQLIEYPLLAMSKLTKALMGNIDYERAKNQRLDNFQYLKKQLQTSFPIEMTSDDIPLVFPLYDEEGATLRDRLIANHIFCARYWPNVMKDAPHDSREYDMTINMVSLPIDQRYTIEDMKRIIEVIKK